MDYIHIDDAVSADGSQIEFQSKTPKSRGMSGTRACNVGCRNASMGLSRHPSDDGVEFIPKCCNEGVEGQRCRLEGAGETHCESLRLRVSCARTSVCIGHTVLSGVSSMYPLFWGMEEGGSDEESGDVGDNECKDGRKDEVSATEIQGIVCSDERPNLGGKGDRHSASEERVQ